MNTTLNLDEQEQRRFHHAAENYGVIIEGGSPDDRQLALEKYLADPIVSVDCRHVNDSDDFIQATLSALGVSDSALDGIHNPGSYEIRNKLEATSSSLIIKEFDAMDESTQASLAQILKAIAEQLNASGCQLGYACDNASSVYQANPDLNGRVLRWGLEEVGD